VSSAYQALLTKLLMPHNPCSLPSLFCLKWENVARRHTAYLKWTRRRGVPTRHTHKWDGLHTRHLLQSTHTNTHKHTMQPDKVQCGLMPWRHPHLATGEKQLKRTCWQKAQSAVRLLCGYMRLPPSLACSRPAPRFVPSRVSFMPSVTLSVGSDGGSGDGRRDGHGDDA